MINEKLTIRGFFQRFHNDDVCLDHIMNIRYGMRHTCHNCGVIDASFHRVSGRRSYACAHCGSHLYPCVGTIFEDSRTSLQVWFYAIYLFVITRHGVSAKELQRQLGVTYKTAWRMGHKIRELTNKADFHAKLVGHIEVDETYVGGKKPGKRGRGAEGKTIVVGLKERSGVIRTEVVNDVKAHTLKPIIMRNVEDASIISTDELRSYNGLDALGYEHGQVKHGENEFVSGIHHVNNVESFWKLFKQSISSTHIHISKKYAQLYLSEFSFRSNHRHLKNAMFDLLIASV